MIKIFDNYYLLETADTSYAFRVTSTGHLEHLYYGSKITASCKEDLGPLVEIRDYAPGNAINYRNSEGKILDPNFSLEDIRLEFSSYGKGDVREPFLEIVNPDGSFTSDFVFESAKVLDKKPAYKTMPTAYYTNPNGEDKASTEEDGCLVIKTIDKENNLILEIIYSVFYENNVITRMTRLVNNSEGVIRVKRLMSTQLDLEGTDYVFHTFSGAWTREMHHNKAKVCGMKAVNSTCVGTSSNRANPFVMISKEDTTEDSGEVYGLNIVYSGNHYEALEAGTHGKSRFVAGINPTMFDYTLESKEALEAPEAVMTYSDCGFNKMSHNLHDFANDHIVRGKFKRADRPVILNSWEAFYFSIDDEILVKLAKKAKEVGVETFVMDDGWFGRRDNDTSSLGDWYVNENKLKGGLNKLVKQVNEIGLNFGIWVEPEMVNEDSDLYRAHPEYALRIPGKSHSEGRFQMILDLTKKEVRDYIISSMIKVFESANISYVKWDMNRIFSDVFSDSLPKDRQGEVFHRYVVGLYEIMKTLTEKFPDILFEGCASGGNRFDLGILSYFPQTWASDDTDAYERVIIQNGYSYGYPQSAYTAHVSDVPNHQTRRVTKLSTRFNVAAFGNLGYECNLDKLSEEEIAQVKAQIEFYKKHRQEMLYGDFYRDSNIPEGNVTNWTVTAKDKKSAVNFIMQDKTVPNLSMNKMVVKGLDSDKKYSVSQVDLSKEKDKQIEKLCDGYGDTLQKAGVFVRPGFVGTGIGENTMDYQDLGSALYYVSEE